MAGPPSSVSLPADDYRPVEVIVVRPERRPYWLHALLFAATIFSTLVVGARLHFNFLAHAPAFDKDAGFALAWILQDPSRLWLGIPFSATLILILLTHEMGHYLYCKRYGVYATLPFFLPAPTLFGTLGAFIRIQSRIPSRQALFDIGIAGPIAGFVVALPALALGMALSRHQPLVAQASDLTLGYPLVFHLLWSLLPLSEAQGTGAALHEIYLHPIAVAGWVGMFATALNLLPCGQLDGGHIVYAVAPPAHRGISRLTIVALIPLGVFFWMGWLVWAALLLLMGSRHPQVPPEPGLDRGRKTLALFALIMLVLTFAPAPAPGSLLEVIAEYRALD
jgi:membrane-associated protease RseP (regulator of RpoE activity)